MHNQSLLLYSSDGCHLCEQALSLLTMIGVSPQVVEIAYDEALFSRYGVTIPVLALGDCELNWPFSLTDLQTWLTNNGITYHT